MQPSRRETKRTRAEHRRRSVPLVGTPPSPALVAAVLFALALALRFLHLWQIRTAPFATVLMGDSKSYDLWAQQIAGGNWIGTDVFYQAPLYPYFLGIIYTFAGHDPFAVRIVQAILGSIAVLFIADATSRLISRRAGYVAGAMAAIYPAAIFFDGLIQKTALDAFLTAAALWVVSALLTRNFTWRRWIVLGMILAALSLTRENALALVVVLLVWCLAGSPGVRDSSAGAMRGRNAAAFVLGLAVLLGPVAIRNAAVGGGFYLTTSQFGTNLYLGNNPRTDGTAGSLIAGRGSAEYERRDATEIAERAAGRTLSPAEVSSYWTAETLGFIRKEPGHWLRLMARKAALLWNSYEAFDTESQESHAEYSTPLRALGWFGHFGVLVPLATLGVWVTWGERRKLAILYVLVLVYAASVALFFIYARYRFPLVPFLLVFAAAGITGAAAWLRDSSARQRTAAAIVVLAVAVFTNWPMLAAGDTLAITEHNLGAALQSDGRLDEAIARYRRAISLNPEYAPAYSNMGAAFVAKGDLDGAIEAYRRALALAPDLADAHFNLGNALMARGNAAAAVEEFQRARDLGDGVDVETNLAMALAAAGRTDEAITAFQRAIGLSPASTKPRYALGRLLLEVGRPADAVEHLRIAAAESTAGAEIMNDYGIALIALGRIDDAIVQFERALARDPSSSQARNNLLAARADGNRRK